MLKNNSEENNQLFTDSINEAKEEYKRKVVEELPEQRETEHSVWNVPKLITYNSKYKEIARMSYNETLFRFCRKCARKDLSNCLRIQKNPK